MSKITLWMFLLLPVSLYSAGQQITGYEINVNISGLQDSTIFLAYHLGDKQYIKDTITLNSLGSGTFSGKERLPEGIYMIVLPGKKYFEILLSSDQYFSASCSLKDYFKTLKFTGSDENTAFVNYQKKWSEMQTKASLIGKRLQNSRQFADSVGILSEMQKKSGRI